MIKLNSVVYVDFFSTATKAVAMIKIKYCLLYHYISYLVQRLALFGLFC